jgi:PAS domain S-box-containing protein
VTKKSTKILLIEDNPGDARLVREALAEAGAALFELSWQKDLAKGLAHLKKNPVDAILLDLTLPDSAGFVTFEKVHAQVPQVAIILLTGSDDDVLAAQAVREGAQDYLVKGDASSSLLVRSIRYAIERKQAEELLRENETRYHDIFEGVEDAIFVQTPFGQILEVNQCACEMFGYTHAQFLTRTVADLVPSEKYIIAFDLKESSALPIHPIETINVRANGEQFPIELSIRLQKQKGKTVLFVVGRDISERKRIEQAIYLMSDTQRQIAHLDDITEIYQLVGKKIQELIGEGYVIVSSLDEKIQAMKVVGLFGFGSLYKNLVRRFKVDPSGFVYLLKDMTKEELRLFRSGRLEKFESGLYHMLSRKVPKSVCDQIEKQLKITGIYTMGFVLNDIHYGGLTLLAKGDIAHYKDMIETIMNQAAISIKRIRAEKTVRESEERFRIIFENANDAIHIDNGDDEILSANPRACEMLGYSPEEMVKLHVSDLQVPEVRQSGNVIKNELLQHGTTIFEGLNLHRSGRRIPVEISVGRIEQTSGELYVSIVRDITERKRAEQEIHRRLTDLNVLYESSLALSSRLTPQEIGRLVIETLKEHLDWHHAVVRIRREESDDLEIIGYSAPGVTEENSALEISRLNGLVSRVDQGMNGWVIQHGEGVRSGDLPSDPRYVETYAGIRSGLYEPMIASEKAIGVIAIESEIANAFDEHDEQLLATMAKITANAMHRNRLRDQTEYQLQRLAALRTIDQAISTSFDLRVTLDIFLKNAVAQLGADAALILLSNPAMNTLEYGAEYGFHNSTFKNKHLRLGEGDAGRVVLERRVMSIPNLHQADKPFMHPELAASDYYASCHAAPLMAKGQVKGVLEIFHRASLNPSPDWLGFFETLAGQAAIAIDNNQLFENLQSSNFELAIAYDETIEGWSRAMDLRDKETEGHTQRVTEMTLRLATGMDFRPEELTHIRRGALLHDIGKMGVPDHILRKPGALTDEEWVSMRKHPQFAYEMLLPITYLRSALDIPYCHHEKWDGSGYPRGLKGEEIPMVARMFALADVWDALTSDRPYRKAWSMEKAQEYLREQSGKHFEPRLVSQFLEEIINV